MNHIEYLLKHHRWLQRVYVTVFSLIFRFLGLFVRWNPRQVLFQSLIGRNYGDSPRVLFEAMKRAPAFAGFRFVWAFVEPERFEVEGADKVKLNSLSYFLTAL